MELFCPVPQMVGGGTVHWQGWLPRFTAERLPAAQRRRRRARAPRWPTGRSPTTSSSRTTTRSSGRSVSPARPAPTRSRGRAAAAIRARRCRMSRYAQKFHQGCAKLGWNSFPTPQAALSRPYNGRPATVVSAFAQQHGDPTGTRSSALNVFVPDALATGRYDLRPDCYVREISVDGSGRVKGAVYEDADGDMVEQEADVVHPRLRRRRDGPAAAAVDSPAGSRTGSPTAATWSAATSPSTSTAPLSGTFDDPIYAWAGGGYVSASTFQFYEHDERRGFVGGGHIAAAGVGIPLPINWRLPGRPDLGRRGQADRPRATSTTAWRSPWCCTTCRSTTTGSSWTTR